MWHLLVGDMCSPWNPKYSTSAGLREYAQFFFQISTSEYTLIKTLSLNSFRHLPWIIIISREGLFVVPTLLLKRFFQNVFWKGVLILLESEINLANFWGSAGFPKMWKLKEIRKNFMLTLKSPYFHESILWIDTRKELPQMTSLNHTSSFLSIPKLTNFSYSQEERNYGEIIFQSPFPTNNNGRNKISIKRLKERSHDWSFT